jgi:hypothetical protein
VTVTFPDAFVALQVTVFPTMIVTFTLPPESGRDPLRASIDRINGIRFQCEVIVAAEEVAGGGSDVADCGHGREHIGVMV